MRLTRVQREFLENLHALNTAGTTPNVSQITAAGGDNMSCGRTLYRAYKQPVDWGLVGNRLVTCFENH